MTRDEYISPKRDTTDTLFEAILKRAREAGDMADIDPILDYALPPLSKQARKLSDYRFDIVPELEFGGSEGIYITLYLRGDFDKTEDKRCELGTIKTLEDRLDACKLMGKLCGILMYHGGEYINENIHRYTPKGELEHEWERKYPGKEKNDD